MIERPMHRFMSHLDDLAGLDVHFRKAVRPAPVASAAPASGRGIVARLRSAVGRATSGGRDGIAAPDPLSADPAAVPRHAR